jgi:PadR family transcriptional regulator PadR
MAAGPKSELLRGTLDMLVLKIVAQRLRQISKEFFTVHQGSLYPALHRLESRGWLSAQWRDTATGREAKFYSLTAKGRKQLESEILGWEQLSGAVALILKVAD